MAPKVKKQAKKHPAKKDSKQRMYTAAEVAKLLNRARKSEPLIEVPRKSGGAKRIKNTSRAFWTDGVHAYLRRRKANPAIIERTDTKAKNGEYRHLHTSDDVEVYEIAEHSPLRRKKLSLAESSLVAIEKTIVRSACQEDFRLYYDAVSEYAYRFKNSDWPEATAAIMLQTSMRYLEHRIMRRGGPTPMRIQQELAGIRRERTGTQIYLPH